MTIAGFYKGYKYPKETPHWTTILKKLIAKEKFVGTWKQAIKNIWQPYKKNNQWRKKTKQVVKKAIKPKPKEVIIKQVIKKEAKKPKEDIYEKPNDEIDIKLPKQVMRNGNEWMYYGNFGINETGYNEYYNYIKKLFTSPGKVSDEKWSEIQKLRKNFYENQSGFDYFPTPKIVVDRIMHYIENSNLKKFIFHEDNKIHLLEPSAGTGSIIKGYIEKFGFDTDKITANEFREDNLLKKLLDGVIIKTGDFLKMPTKEDYDLIIMNPPFNATGRIDYFMEHIAHAINMLSRGGVMFVLCPAFHKREDEYNEKIETNKQLKSVFLHMNLTDSKKMTEPMKKRINANGDFWTYEKEKDNKYFVEMRDHQIELLGYTSGEFDTVQHEKKRDVYSLKPLGMKIALYKIIVV